jgi:hypothetical protein
MTRYAGGRKDKRTQGRQSPPLLFRPPSLIRLVRTKGDWGVPRHGAIGVAVSVASMILAATPAAAVVKGSRSQSLTSYTVRLVGNGDCSGVVIARRAVATARHCAYGMVVVASRHWYRVAHVSRNATLDDGTRVRVTGDAAILHLSKPLPETVEAVPVGEGAGDTFTIAGYGTTNERWRGGTRLHKAELVSAGEFVLVDPERKSAISASACYGDSGGPVLRGGWLVGVITRAAHPSRRIACGDLTRWAPIAVVSADESDVANALPLPRAKPARRPRPQHAAKKKLERSWVAGLFGLRTGSVATRR